MADLSREGCEACRADAPRLSSYEIEEFRQADIPQWHVEDVAGVPRLVRIFTFPDWESALRFTNRIGEIAEEENHHPAILTEWGKVTVSWWSHKIQGLHRNDVIMAAKTDTLLGSGLRASL